MKVSVRAPYVWRCEECDQECQAPVWRIIDARERADVLEGPSHGVSWVDCPSCGTREHIDAPLLVLRPGVTAPLLLAVSVAELHHDPPESSASLLEEAQRAGVFSSGAFAGQVIPLPRRLLPVVLARDLDQDLRNPEAACQQLQPEGLPTVTNYDVFLRLLDQERDETRVRELLRAVLASLPDQLAELIRAHPEMTGSTRIRDAGRAELRAVAGTPLEAGLRMRQQLLDDLCDGRTSQNEAVQRYFDALDRFGHTLRTRLYAMYHTARDNNDPEGIPLAREALELAAQLGEERLETELAARLGERLVVAVHAGLDADLSEALRLLEHALGRLPEGSLQWVEVANNLATAHHLRTEGDRLEIWESARALLARATALDRREHPEFWARIQTNYGLLLAERPGGNLADLTLGIDHIKAGLEERSPERNAVDWAYSLINLGLLLYRRAEPDDLRQAEQCYRDALQRLGAGDAPWLWSQLQCNLADLLLSRDPADARGARAAATEALKVSEAHPGLLNIERVKWLLARASDQLDGSANAESLRLRQEALAVTPPLVSPALHLAIGCELLDAYASAERWTDAADVASNMLTAMDALYDAQVTVAGRRSALAAAPRLARWAAFLLARVGRPELAVEAIERGMARELSVLTGRGAAELEALEQIDPPLARRYRLAQTRYRSSIAEPSATTPGGLTSGVREQAAAERDLRTVIEEIRGIPGLERFLRTTELGDIVRAAGGKPIAYLVNAPSGSYVLQIPRTRSRTKRAAGGTVADDTQDTLPAVRSIPVPEVSSVTITHLLVMDTQDHTTPGLLLAQQAGALRRRRLISAALGRLGLLEPLMRPIAKLLTDDPQHEAVVIPTGWLGMFPLHAVPLGPASGEVLDDIGTLFISPSAAVHAASRSRAARPPAAAPCLVAVTDPDGSLPGSRTELAEIASLFDSRGEASCAIGPEATVGWLLDNLAKASYLHMGCHGSASLDRQGGSLALADGRLDMDTLARHHLPTCRLAVASACQSGHYAIVDNPDEFLGLPAGFLQAGAACAVASLWQVDDLATAVLMTRFYELLSPAHGASGVPPVPALRRSRTWMRRLTWEEFWHYASSHRHLAHLAQRYAAPTMTANERPFALPVYWAAFTAWGV